VLNRAELAGSCGRWIALTPKHVTLLAHTNRNFIASDVKIGMNN
jgi:hypothetical protein